MAEIKKAGTCYSCSDFCKFKQVFPKFPKFKQVFPKFYHVRVFMASLNLKFKFPYLGIDGSEVLEKKLKGNHIFEFE